MKRLFGMLAMVMVLMMVLAACSAAVDEGSAPAADDTTAGAKQTTEKDDDMAKATEEKDEDMKDDAMDKEEEMKDDAMDKDDESKDDTMDKEEDMKDDAMDDKDDESKDDTMDKEEDMKDDAMDDKDDEAKDDAMAKEEDMKDDAMDDKDEDMKDDTMEKEEETKDDAMDDKEEATTEKETMTEAAVEETTAATAIKNTGKAAPDFSLSDLDGNTVSLASLKGEKVYVKYWASWCSICVGGLPEIDQLSTADTDFEVVTIVTPGHLGEKSVDDFKQWFAARGFDNITVLLDVDGTYAKQFGIRGVPTSAYIGSDGILVQVLPGHASTAQIEAKFDNIY